MTEVQSGTPRRRRGEHRPTVADVAHKAGVSAMTVSRVVNGDTHVREATRIRVLAAVAELGYVPNQAARSLAGGKQFRIALLHSNPSAAYLSEFMVGALREASASGAQLLVEHCAENPDPAAIAVQLADHRIDACLLPPPLCDDARLIAAMLEQGMPIAQVATGQPHPQASSVAIDDEAAAHAMTARLIAKGHRRIGFISGNPNQTASALRRAGFARALAEAGIAADPRLIANGDFTYRSGLAAARKLLGCKPRPTAIFASNDDMAAASVAVAHQQGLDVPRDISICGFDDTAMATTIWPELTTIRQPITEMARIAVKALVKRSKPGAPAPRPMQLKFTLVGRESDGAVPPK
ncbi:LacI family DNA-binding transcriptional regulator [Novosphingobium bradum]|uniref:LacI family DNA-binding transcriptional regulator n=1 Tax=Novosphingobium bradum TaxID=1737444 RepID=A0ABV7IN42_9SPHN